MLPSCISHRSTKKIINQLTKKLQYKLKPKIKLIISSNNWNSLNICIKFIKCYLYKPLDLL